MIACTHTHTQIPCPRYKIAGACLQHHEQVEPQFHTAFTKQSTERLARRKCYVTMSTKSALESAIGLLMLRMAAATEASMTSLTAGVWSLRQCLQLEFP